MNKTLLFSLSACLLLTCSGRAGAASGDWWHSLWEDPTPESPPASSLWPNGMGNGLSTHANELAVSVGPALGTQAFGRNGIHNLMLVHVDYARVRTRVLHGPGPLRGSLDGRLELMGAVQYDPHSAYLFSFTPVLQYNVATGTRWMPFVDAGAGLAVTDIRGPDLSTLFQFALQGGGGCYYFLRDNLALTLQYRFLHVSNACIELPNVGVNAHIITVGLSRYF